jgi:hypothetical protein
MDQSVGGVLRIISCPFKDYMISHVIALVYDCTNATLVSAPGENSSPGSPGR